MEALTQLLASEFVQGAIAGGIAYLILGASAYALPPVRPESPGWYVFLYRFVHYLAVNLDRANRKHPTAPGAEPPQQ